MSEKPNVFDQYPEPTSRADVGARRTRSTPRERRGRARSPSGLRTHLARALATGFTAIQGVIPSSPQTRAAATGALAGGCAATIAFVVFTSGGGQLDHSTKAALVDSDRPGHAKQRTDSIAALLGPTSPSVGSGTHSDATATAERSRGLADVDVPTPSGPDEASVTEPAVLVAAVAPSVEVPTAVASSQGDAASDAPADSTRATAISSPSGPATSDGPAPTVPPSTPPPEPTAPSTPTTPDASSGTVGRKITVFIGTESPSDQEPAEPSTSDVVSPVAPAQSSPPAASRPAVLGGNSRTGMVDDRTSRSVAARETES